MPFFDYEKAGHEAGIPPDVLAEICRTMRAEFPGDDMMYELHVLRACMAVKSGIVRLEDVAHPAAPSQEAGRHVS